MFKKFSLRAKRSAIATATLLAVGFGSQASATPVLDATSGHYYDAVSGAINWNNAKTAAEALSYAGFQGHLATITSVDEQQFINSNLPSALGMPGSFGYWIGGSREESANNFTWVTGEAFNYTHWNAGEPNFDAGFTGIHFFGLGSPAGAWNDANAGGWNFPGYVVEFERTATAAVPEPGSVVLLGLGLLGLAASKRKKA